MEWGDVGRLYLCARMLDLAATRFDRSPGWSCSATERALPAGCAPPQLAPNGLLPRCSASSGIGGSTVYQWALPITEGVFDRSMKGEGLRGHIRFTGPTRRSTYDVEQQMRDRTR
jgi:hypothetical protein